MMALFALLLVLPLRDGSGDETIPGGGDSGGELSPALQVLLPPCSPLSPVEKERVIGFSILVETSPRNSICGSTAAQRSMS